MRSYSESFQALKCWPWIREVRFKAHPWMSHHNETLSMIYVFNPKEEFSFSMKTKTMAQVGGGRRFAIHFFFPLAIWMSHRLPMSRVRRVHSIDTVLQQFRGGGGGGGGGWRRFGRVGRRWTGDWTPSFSSGAPPPLRAGGDTRRLQKETAPERAASPVAAAAAAAPNERKTITFPAFICCCWFCRPTRLSGRKMNIFKLTAVV